MLLGVLEMLGLSSYIQWALGFRLGSYSHTGGTIVQIFQKWNLNNVIYTEVMPARILWRFLHASHGDQMCQAFKYANNVTKMYSLRFIVTVADHQQQDQFDND